VPSAIQQDIAGRIDAMIKCLTFDMGVCSYDILKGCGAWVRVSNIGTFRKFTIR